MISKFIYNDSWQLVKDAAMNTIGKKSGKYPDNDWKIRLLMSEHSPIRLQKYVWMWEDILSWVSVHFTRHKIGIEHWVKTQRTDRTDIDRNKLPQDTKVNHTCEADAQANINISRRRMCTSASKETRDYWKEYWNKIAEVDKPMAYTMVPECIYRGGCPEYPKSCGLWESFCKKHSDENLLDIHERYKIYNKDRGLKC